MNRTILTAMAFAIANMACIVPLMAGVLPDISGRTFTDVNLNGTLDAGEGVPGAMIKLFQDDGDGILEPNADVEVTMVVTDSEGGYRFGEIGSGKYFVHQPKQVVAGFQLPESSSGIIEPLKPELVIDRFETASSVFADPYVPAATDARVIQGNEVLGLERDLAISWSSGKGRAKLRVSPYSEDLLQYDTAPGVVAKAVVTWDGIDGDSGPTPSLGLGGIDLTNQGANEGLVFKMGVDQPGDGEMVRVRLFHGSNQTFSEADVSLPVTNGTASEFTTVPFSSFNGVVNPADVDAIQLIIGDGNRSIDAQIDLVGVYGNNVHNFVAVPEPGACGLLLLGVASLFARRVRRN